MQATRPEQVNTWIETVSSNLPHLSRSQATVLALWSFAAIIQRSASLSLSTLLLAGLLDQQTNTLRQRLKEFYKPKHRKSGLQRQELDVTTCFAPLMAWVLRLWPYSQVTLALDPTLCRDRFVCLAVSLVYDGGSIPLAWKVLPANQKGTWTEHWPALLRPLRSALPESVQIMVLADRGLYARRLYRHICRLGMHPLMRLTRLGQWRERGHTRWYVLPDLLPGTGYYYRGRGAMFKTRRYRLRCTLIALWEEGYDEPWYLITNLAPEACEGACYGLRTWIEQGFRCVKSYGFEWERSRMSEPDRMERLWLVYAVSLLWTQAVAGQIESQAPMVVALGLSRSDLTSGSMRRISRFRLGLMLILLALIKGQTLPLPQALHPTATPVMSGCKRVQLLKEQQV